MTNLAQRLIAIEIEAIFYTISYIITFCYTKSYNMLTIRIDKETKKLISYLRLHKVRFTGRLRLVIIEELHKIADEFKYKSNSNCPF